MTAPNFGPDPMAQILPLLQFMAAMKQRRGQEADALIGRLPNQGAGVTMAEAGLSDKQQKAKYGRVLKPTDMVVADSPESRANRMLMSQIDAMTPDQTDSFTASLRSKMMGVPQITTTKGLASQAAASEGEAGVAATTAGTKGAIANSTHKMVLEGLASLDQADAAVRQRAGLKAAGMQTPEESQSDMLATQISNLTKKEALKALADPSHPLNKVMSKELGFNAITAAPAIAMGMSNIMDNVANIAYQKTVAGKAMDLAILQAQLDADKELNRTEADWAKSVADEMGGTVTPRTVLNWKRWQESGGDPKSMPRGLTPQVDGMLSTATTIAQKAKVLDAAGKGDPYAQQILKLGEAAGKIQDKNTLESVGKLMARYFGRVQAASKLGPRPPDGDPKQKAWDMTADALTAKMPQLKANSWITGGVSINQQDPTKVPAAAPNTRPQALNIGGQQITPPPDISQEDLQSLQAIVSALQSSSKLPINLAPKTPPQTP